MIKVNNVLSIITSKDTNLLISLSAFIFVIAVVYLIGNLNATISHIVFDRTLVRNIIGYPIFSILNIPNNVRLFSKAINLYISLALLAILLLPIFKIWLPHNMSVKILILFSMVAIVALILLRILWAILERYFVNNNNAEYPRLDDLKRAKAFLGFMHTTFCFPFTIIYKTVFKLSSLIIGSDKLISKEIVDKFKRNIYIKFEIDANNLGTDNYWLSIILMDKECPNISAKLNNWLNLYGFLRNLATVMLLLCMQIGFYLFLQSKHIGYILLRTSDTKVFTTVLFVVLFSSFVLLSIRYWIIYKNYYTKYLVRSFAVFNETGIH